MSSCIQLGYNVYCANPLYGNKYMFTNSHKSHFRAANQFYNFMVTFSKGGRRKQTIKCTSTARFASVVIKLTMQTHFYNAVSCVYSKVPGFIEYNENC